MGEVQGSFCIILFYNNLMKLIQKMLIDYYEINEYDIKSRYVIHENNVKVVNCGAPFFRWHHVWQSLLRKLVQTYFLCDSGYSSVKIMDSFLKNGFYTVGDLKRIGLYTYAASNRK